MSLALKKLSYVWASLGKALVWQRAAYHIEAVSTMR